MKWYASRRLDRRCIKTDMNLLLNFPVFAENRLGNLLVFWVIAISISVWVWLPDMIGDARLDRLV